MKFKRSNRGRKPGTPNPGAGKKPGVDPPVSINVSIPTSRVELFGGKSATRLKLYEAVLTPEQLRKKIQDMVRHNPAGV